MTYHLPPLVEKILVPVIVVMPDGTTQNYRSGKEAAEKAFDALYDISAIRVDGDSVELQLYTDEFSSESAGKEQEFF